MTYTASIVIPMHNAESTIGAAISSALDGSAEIEIIVCDDASSDNSISTVEGFRNSNIRLIKNHSNLGPGPSRDTAIAESRAPWIALLDADDTWAPERMGRLLAAAYHTNADVVFDNTMLCHDTPNGFSPWKALHGERAFGGTGTTARRIRIEDYISAERLLIHPIIRTEFIRKHGVRHSARRFAEDAEFYLRLAHAGAKFCYVPQPMYFYRITPGSLTAQAKDPSLMRKCLEECARWPNWSPTAQEAFRFKIATLRRNEMLYEARRLARTGSVCQAIRLLASEPKAFAALPGRLIRQLHYFLHRRLHGGVGR